MDMSHGSPSPNACKISMLWNWYTVDACFLSTQWHIRSAGAFAGSVIAVFIITALVEGVRRAAREYDRQIVVQAQARLKATEASARLTSDDSSGKGLDSDKPVRVRPTIQQQLVRGVFFGIQFTVAYLLMLIAMYYNGYMLMAIILGGIAGYVVFATDTLGEISSDEGARCC